MGWLTGPETQSYWSLLNSGRDSAQTGPALVRLVGAARYDAGRRPPSPKLRPLVGPGGTTAILRCQWPKPTVGLRWTCLGSSPPESSYATIDCEPLGDALHSVWQKAGPGQARLYFSRTWDKAVVAIPRRVWTELMAGTPGLSSLSLTAAVRTIQGIWFVPTPQPECPHPEQLRKSRGVQFFAVRQMRCRYGTYGALGLMATPWDWAVQRAVGQEHILFYSKYVKIARVLEPHGVLVFGGGMPGTNAYACAREGIVNSLGADKTVRWFAKSPYQTDAPVSCYLGSGRNALVDDVVSAAVSEGRCRIGSRC